MTILRRKWWLIALTCLALGACSEDNSDDSSSAGEDDLDSLAKITGPVSSSSSKLGVSSKVGSLATTGVALSSAASLSWTSSHSRPFCESVSMVKDLLQEASQPDVILCYVGVMRRNGLFASTIDDGNYHYYSLQGDEEMGGNGGIKFKIVKNDAGTITNFEMFTCFQGSSSSPSQDSYISQVNSSGTVTATSLYMGTDDQSGGIYKGKLVASGNYSNSAWTSKTVTADRSFSDSGSSFGMSATLGQGADDLTLDGYMYGKMVFGTNSEYFKNEFYTAMEIVNSTQLSSFALGDGSSKYSITWKQDSGNDCGDCNYSTGAGSGWDNSYSPGSLVDSWNGDTRVPLGTASSGPYYTQANAGTPTSASGVPSISFTSEQTWDCTGDFTSVQMQQSIESQFSECDTKYGLNDRDWVNCSAAQ